MSIQSTINQGLSLAGLLISQNPMIKNIIEAKEISGKAIAAEKGLTNIKTDVYDKLKSGEKSSYSETEISDIVNRIGSLNRDIYTGIISREDPRFKNKKIAPGLMPREKRSQMLKELGNLRAVNEAKRAAEMAGKAKNLEREASKSFINSFNKGGM